VPVSQCQICSAPTDIALCARHVTDLSATLTAIPQWIDNLLDVALRQTRLGGPGKRAKGDEMPSLFAPDTTTAKGETRSTKQAQASILVEQIRNDVITWHRHMCEARGITWVSWCFIGPLRPGQRREPGRPSIETAALWLAENAHAIACDEAAGECFTTFEQHAKAAERVVDLPTRRTWLGQCPTWNERSRTACGVTLWAPEDAIEVRCHQCRGTHKCDRLKLLLFNDLEREKVPWEKILRANKSQPQDRQVPERTLQSWRSTGKLKAHGFRRPNGRVVINRHSEDDEPLYLWPDVRKLRDAKPQKKVTGAAARQRVAN
jgi:hypothetical protein